MTIRTKARRLASFGFKTEPQAHLWSRGKDFVWRFAGVAKAAANLSEDSSEKIDLAVDRSSRTRELQTFIWARA